MRKGFTIVEMIVVIAVVSIMVLILAQIFSRTLRSSSKAQALGSVKQNGQAALEAMDKTIRNSGSRYVICPAPTAPSGTVTGTTLVVQSIDGVFTRYRFINGQIQQDYPSAFGATLCQDNLVNPQTITDADPKTGVSVASGGGFSINRQAGIGDTVTIDFYLNPGIDIAPVFSGQIDPIRFMTTITLRGYTDINK